MDTLNTYSVGAVLDATDLDPLVRDIKVFRVGTFRNSAGVQRTWTADELRTAAENFRTLRDSGVLPNVPVRLDHTQSVKDVVGYFQDVRFDGTFLVADLFFTNRQAREDYENGTLRNRSLEIGKYRDNNDTIHEPVVQGLAWVDLGAVEGLYRHPGNPGEGDASMGTQNEPATTVTDEGNGAGVGDGNPGTPATTPPTPTSPTTGPSEPVTPSPGTGGGEGDGTGGGEGTGTGGGEGVAQHSAQREVHTFRIGGAAVSDPAAVQSHIDTLEKFRTDTIEEGRTSFVDSLAARKIVLPKQAEKMREMVKGMSPEQFTLFRESYEDAPPANLYGRHDLGEPGTPEATATDAVADRKDLLESVVSRFRVQGLTQEQIEATPSWRELQTIKGSNS